MGAIVMEELVYVARGLRVPISDREIAAGAIIAIADVGPKEIPHVVVVIARVDVEAQHGNVAELEGAFSRSVANPGAARATFEHNRTLGIDRYVSGHIAVGDVVEEVSIADLDE